MNVRKVMIQRIQLNIASKFWDNETEQGTPEVLGDYQISPEQIISIVSDQGGVWLYWWVDYWEEVKNEPI